MRTSSKTLIDLETKFWQALVAQDADTAISLLCEPAVMVGPHGALKFDHARYREMAEQGPVVLKAFEFSDMDVVFPTEQTAVLTYRVRQEVVERKGSKPSIQQMAESSTWVRDDDDTWRCAAHTETPMAEAGARP